MNGEYKVYRNTFPDGKIYIGVTKFSIQHRKDCGYSHNEPLKNAIRQNRGKVTVDILENNLSKEEAFQKEIFYISLFNATDTNVGYNISLGGQSTFCNLKHSDEYKAKMSELNKGKKYSPETINRMILSHERERKAVLKVSDDGTISEYESLGAAAKSVNGYKSNISRSCEYHKRYKGYFWRWKGVI